MDKTMDDELINLSPKLWQSKLSLMEIKILGEKVLTIWLENLSYTFLTWNNYLIIIKFGIVILRKIILI